MSDSAPLSHLEPEDFDGHSLEDLVDYLEAGRRPADPSIDDSPACRRVLDALERLHALAGRYLDEGDDPVEGAPDWIGGVLASIPVDAKPGRRFPVPVARAEVDATVTEGALRGLIRAIGDDVPGLLVGSVQIGQVEPVPISIDVAVVVGTVVPAAIDRFRSELLLVLPDHAPFVLGDIDVRVVGLIAARDAQEPGGRA